jgi:sec-independent protein translocase protein TatC
MNPLRRGSTPKPERTPEAVMTLTEHLAELRTRIIRCALAVILGAILLMAFYDEVIRFLARPYQNLCEERGVELCSQAFDADGRVQFINLDPVQGLSTRLSVATYGGLLLALPIVMWQIWKFVVPALKSNEKKYAIPFITSSISLFALGGLLAYLTLGKALEFLISWAGEDVNSNYTITSYVRLVLLMVAAFGVGFQFPVLLVSFQFVGILSPQQLFGAWRYAIVGIVVMAAVITPSGDPISLSALAVPMLVLYFVAAGIGLIAQRRRAATAEHAPVG